MKSGSTRGASEVRAQACESNLCAVRLSGVHMKSEQDQTKDRTQKIVDGGNGISGMSLGKNSFVHGTISVREEIVCPEVCSVASAVELW